MTEEETTPDAEEAAETAAEEEAADEAVVEEAAAEETVAEEAVAEETVAEEVTAEEAVAEEVAEEVGEVDADAVKEKSDLPPGADLEPIAIEPEAELDAEERARLEAEAEERAEREAALEQTEDDAPIEGPAPVKIDGEARYRATGKRKRSVARVIILPGDGRITINDREIDEYFPRARHRTVVTSPLVATGYEKTVEVRITVHGGGISGQAGAVRHGIARALTEVNPELRPELKRRGFLTRDSRAKERRKAGLKKARKRPQFSKR